MGKKIRILLDVPDFDLGDLYSYISDLIVKMRNHQLFGSKILYAYNINTIKSLEIFDIKGYCDRIDIENVKDLTSFTNYPVITIFFNNWHKRIQNFIDDIYLYEKLFKRSEEDG